MQNTNSSKFYGDKVFQEICDSNRVGINRRTVLHCTNASTNELVKYSPILHLSDGYSFSKDEVCDTGILFSDIMWPEGVNAKHSLLHIKNGKTIALPFGTHGLEIILRDSKEAHFLKISRNMFIPVSMIEKVSRKVVCLKGCDIPFKVSVNYFPVLFCGLYEYLTSGIEKWCVQDYIRWKARRQQI